MPSLMSQLLALKGPLPVEFSSALLAKGLMRPDGQVLMTVPLEQTIVDYTYQRPSVCARVNGLVKDYDPRYAAVTRLSQRGRGLNPAGKFYVNDGAHQITTRKNRQVAGKGDDTAVLALVEINSNRKVDAGRFKMYNNCKPVSGNEKFRAELAMGVPNAVACKRLVGKYGFELEFRSSSSRRGSDALPSGICSVAKLYGAYCKMPNQVEDALRLLLGVYGKSPNTYANAARTVSEKLRAGEIVVAIAVFLQGQFGSVESIIANLKDHPLDLAEMWKKVQNAPRSDSRPVQLAKLIEASYSLILKGRISR